MSEHEILDDFKEKQEAKHTKKSFRQLCIALFCYAFIIGIFYFQINQNTRIISAIYMVSVLAGLIYPISGLFHGIKSIRHHEPNSFQKIIGFVGNLILSTITLSLIFFNIIDLFRWS